MADIPTSNILLCDEYNYNVVNVNNNAHSYGRFSKNVHKQTTITSPLLVAVARCCCELLRAAVRCVVRAVRWRCSLFAGAARCSLALIAVRWRCSLLAGAAAAMIVVEKELQFLIPKYKKLV
jgi:hypothetical protein